MRFRVALCAFILVAGATMSACGVPVDRGPTTLSRRSVPFGLLAPSPPVSTAVTSPSPVELREQVYFLSAEGHLAPVDRQMPAPAPLATILDGLLVGPTATEAAQGLQSAVPAQTEVLSATVASGTATVDLGGAFGQLVGQSEIEAVAQVVFTATAQPGVTSVVFELSGQPVAVPTAAGAEVAVAERAQFAQLAPT
ncbi:MAG: GerMN domain-containing protein [Acidimicrobiales bacterium]